MLLFFSSSQAVGDDIEKYQLLSLKYRTGFQLLELQNNESNKKEFAISNCAKGFIASAGMEIFPGEMRENKNFLPSWKTWESFGLSKDIIFGLAENCRVGTDEESFFPMLPINWKEDHIRFVILHELRFTDKFTYVTVGFFKTRTVAGEKYFRWGDPILNSMARLKINCSGSKFGVTRYTTFKESVVDIDVEIPNKKIKLSKGNKDDQNLIRLVCELH